MHIRRLHSSFDSITLFATCDNLDDSLQVLRNARTVQSLSPQRLVRGQRVVHCFRLRF